MGGSSRRFGGGWDLDLSGTLHSLEENNGKSHGLITRKHKDIIDFDLKVLFQYLQHLLSCRMISGFE